MQCSSFEKNSAPALPDRLISAFVFAVYTLMILSFRTDMSKQTVQTQIRLLLQEQSDQGLHYLLFHLFGVIPSGLAVV